MCLRNGGQTSKYFVRSSSASSQVLKSAEYIIDFCENKCAKITIGNLKIAIDFQQKKCSNNKAIRCYDSDEWGQDVPIEWTEA